MGDTLKRHLRALERAGNRVHIPMTRDLGLSELLKRTASEIGDDHVAAFAASLAYRGLFAVFPFLVLIISVLGAIRATDVLGSMVDRVSPALPEDAVSLIERQIDKLTSGDSDVFTVGAVLGALVALWGLSGAFRAIMEAMNVMYDVSEPRSLARKYAISVCMSVASVVLLLAALVLVVAGPAIAERIAAETSLGVVFVLTWKIVQWPVLCAFVLIAFASIYYVAPATKQEFRWISPGSIVAATLWLVFSLLFSLYVNNFGAYDATYGTIAGVIVLMLYMYYSSFILLAGAQINQVVERHAPDGKRHGEKRPRSSD